MAIQTFTSGQILTAADTNTYLANSGLVYSSATTVGSAVATHVVSGCFSATYDNYKIIMSGIAFSGAGAAVYLKINGSTGSTYYGNMIYNVPTSSAIAGVSAANGTSNGFFIATSSSSGTTDVEIVISAPFLARTANCFGTYAGRSYNGSFGSHDSNAASSTGFTLAPGSGTMTGGTVTVYGFRQA